MMDIKDIQHCLPHRYPFLLVDRVLECEPGKHIVAYKNITINEPCFTGHFPGDPIFPGVLTIEAMAQTCGLLGFRTQGTTSNESSAYLLVGTDKTRFKRQVIPGDQLMMTSTLVMQKRNVWKFDCVAKVDDQLACSATILCAQQRA